MNLTEQLKALNEFDLADLDLDNMGGWPNALKATVMVLLFLLLLGAGFYWHIEALTLQTLRKNGIFKALLLGRYVQKVVTTFFSPSIGPIQGVLCHLCGTPRKIIISTS